SMRRPGSVALLVLVSTAALVVAANVHFIQGPTVTATNTSPTVSGTLAGLGNQDITIQLNAQATVTCTNKGGNPPPGQTESVSATISGLRAENGTLKFSITAQASN